MSNHVRTTTPAGEAIVIVPAHEYELLVAAAEDRRDAAIADAALADYRAGRVEALTADEMRDLLASPSPVAFWRRKRKLTQAALAQAAGVTQGYLAQIESRKRTGPVALYLKLAKALDVTIDRLVDEDDPAATLA